ncbi:MAG: PLP-dependent aspartate aminotransferase family protein [Candidatus Bipolaricaulia bacterium]
MTEWADQRAETGFDTDAVHAGEHVDPTTGSVDVPIYQTSTFAPGSSHETARVTEGIQSGERGAYLYSRWGNPTVEALEDKLAALEDAEAAIATSSGMAAITTSLMTVLSQGDHIVAGHQLYSGTMHFLNGKMPELGIETTFVDPTDIGNVAEAIRSETKLVYIETPSNPTLEITDIAAVADLAQSHDLWTMIDNTFATPYNQRPLSLGIDLALHATTKYLSGHGDTLGGAIMGRRDLVDNIRSLHRDLGGVMSPMTAWLTLRGIRTLGLRLARHNEGAQQIAFHLDNHPKVARVFHPALTDHPGHQIARRQMKGGYGGMVSFELKGGYQAGVDLIDNVEICTQAVSLGDVKTLITHPASTTNYITPKAEREAKGINDGLIRLSVGIEDPEDLMADLDGALERGSSL